MTTAPPPLIRIATLTGSLTKMPEAIVRIFSLLNQGVHTEIWFNGFRIAAMGEHHPKESCVQVTETPELESYTSVEGWHVVTLPISDPQKALDFISRVHSLPIPYNINVSECALPKCLLDEIDGDLDCCHPEHWNSLFCSQFALLFLRYCANQGILQIPDDRAKLLWSVNSKGCLPSRLQIITDRVFGQGR